MDVFGDRGSFSPSFSQKLGNSLKIERLSETIE
jgi:tRNA U54 and U55 pseudouridine synthase Pus10